MIHLALGYTLARFACQRCLLTWERAMVFEGGGGTRPQAESGGVDTRVSKYKAGIVKNI